MRRGVLMTMLQQAASQLPMMIGKASERYRSTFLPQEKIKLILFNLFQ